MEANPVADGGGSVHLSYDAIASLPGSAYWMGLMGDDQGIDAVEGQGQADPEERGEEDAAQDGQKGVGEQEIGGCGALLGRGRVVIGGVKRRRVHGTTSLILRVGVGIEGQLSPKGGRGCTVWVRWEWKL